MAKNRIFRQLLLILTGGSSSVRNSWLAISNVAFNNNNYTKIGWAGTYNTKDNDVSGVRSCVIGWCSSTSSTSLTSSGYTVVSKSSQTYAGSNVSTTFSATFDIVQGYYPAFSLYNNTAGPTWGTITKIWVE